MSGRGQGKVHASVRSGMVGLSTTSQTLLSDLQKGRFAERQIFGKNSLIAWSHRKRFGVALELARRFAGKRILDYGCGDATFLAMLMGGETPPSLAIGAERDPDVVQDCRRRFAGIPGLRFIDLNQVEWVEHENRYDTLCCMEVLEHALDVEAVLSDFERFLAPSGTLIVSIPVETGLPLLIKQAGRRLAGLQGIRGYVGHSGYSLGELACALFAGPSTQIARIVHEESAGRAFYDHKGFNWMAMRERIAARFVLERTFGSPFKWLSPHLSSQVWLMARKRGESTVRMLRNGS